MDHWWPISLTHICVIWHHVLKSTALLIHTFMVIYDDVFNQNQNFPRHPYQHAITEPMLGRYRPGSGTLCSYSAKVYCKTPYLTNKWINHNIKSRVQHGTRMKDPCPRACTRRNIVCNGHMIMVWFRIFQFHMLSLFKTEIANSVTESVVAYFQC